jgi:biotin carboxylase
VPDALDYDQLLRGVAYLTFRHGKMDWLESHNEFWLETDARLRTDFNIPGIKVDLITDIKAKSRMKARFIAAGVPVARGRVVHSPDEARLLIAETGYPVVAKPDIGVGAAHTYRINDDAQLARFFEAKPPIDYIMEEFISGVIYSFDGLADREGNPVFYTAHVFSQGIMETVNEDQDLYYHSLREIPADLEDAGRRTLAAFDVRARFFHLEFFRTHRDGRHGDARHDDDRIVALEVNLRPPGGPTMDMFNYANEADLYQEWANVITGGPVRTSYDRPYFCGFAGRKPWRTYRRSHDEVMAAFGPLIVHFEHMSPVFHRVLGDAAYVMRSPELDEIKAGIRYVLEPA